MYRDNEEKEKILPNVLYMKNNTYLSRTKKQQRYEFRWGTICTPLEMLALAAASSPWSVPLTTSSPSSRPDAKELPQNDETL